MKKYGEPNYCDNCGGNLVTNDCTCLEDKQMFDKINCIDIIIATCKTKDEVNGLISEITLNTPEPHRIIATCQPLSASKNRNFGLSYANSDIIVMCDDDMTGFLQRMVDRFNSTV